MEEATKPEEMEAPDLVARPIFTELSNGRFRCVETGHEMVAGDVESYSRSKRCRLALIDFAVCQNKPPFNMFKQDPLCRSKLICKLTGDRVNKSEQHIWKHINGRRFLKKLEQKKAESVMSKRKVVVLNKEQKMKKTVDEIITEVRDPSKKQRDFDRDSGDCDPNSNADSESESDESNGTGNLLREDSAEDSEDISARTKRMSIEIGPSSYASRKKKTRNDSPC